MNRRVIFYNWNAVKKASKNRTKLILMNLEYILDKRICLLRKEFFVNSRSYLVNLADLIINKRKYTEQEIRQYLDLASLRNYVDYKYRGDTSLDKDILTQPVDILSNRLLTISDNKIRFYYEENTYGSR